jgi:hypothetical protein
MDRELGLDVGQANEIKLAARRAGATNADLKLLSEGDMFARILPVIRGLAEVVFTVDLEADPFVPDGWEVVEHQKGGQIEWDPTKVFLYLSPNQQDGKVIKGELLRAELTGKPVFNVNMLDFLLANPTLIPDSWKGKAVFFWGTIYRSSDGNLCVRYLYWHVGRWNWDDYWLELGWYDCNPAAVPAK